MGVKSDEYGFLIGDGADTWPKAIDQWEEIARDVRLIRLLLEGERRNRKQAVTPKLRTPVNSIASIADVSKVQSVASPKPRNDNRYNQQPKAHPSTKKIDDLLSSQARLNKALAKPVIASIEVSKPLAPSIINDSMAGRISNNSVVNYSTADSLSVSRIVGKVEAGNIEALRAPRVSVSSKSPSEVLGDTPVVRSPSEPVIAKPAPVKKRDSNGRFTSEDQSNIDRAIKAISGLGNNIFEGKEELDPAIAATKEMIAPIKAVAKPLSTGFKYVANRSKEAKKTAWYKKIYRQLRYSRRDENAWNKKQLQTLKDIDENGNGKSKGGILKFLSGLAGGVTGINGLLLKILSALAIGKLAGRAMGWTGSKGGADSKARKSGTLISAGKKFGPKLLRKIPLLGALLAGGSIAMDEANDNLSRADKNIRIGENIGTATGAVGGAATGALVGSAILPVIGTAVGAAIGGFMGSEGGAIIGRYAGEFFNPERIDRLFNSISISWDSAIGVIGSTWDSTMSWVEEKKNSVVSSVSEGIKTVNEKIKDTTGVDVVETTKSVVNTVSETATEVKDIAIDTLKSVDAGIKSITGTSVSEVATTVSESASSGYNSVTNFFSSGFNKLKNTFSENVAKPVVTTTKQAVDWGKSKAKGGKAKSSKDKKRDELWSESKSDLIEASKIAGVDAGTVAAIANFESGFKSDARPVANDSRKNNITQFDGTRAISSAYGYGQFIDGTWKDVLNRHGAKYGVKGAGKLTTEQANKYRGNEKIQAAMLAEFTKENVAKGRKLGGKDDLANVYALHNLGAGDGPKFLKALKKNPNTPVSSVLTRSVIANNPSLYKGGRISVQQAYEKMGQHMQAGDPYIREARALQKQESIQPVAKNSTASIKPPVVSKPVFVGPPMPNQVLQKKQQIVMPPKVQVAAQRVSSAGSSASASVRIPPPEEKAGRDLPQRQIAHIITGGIAK